MESDPLAYVLLASSDRRTLRSPFDKGQFSSIDTICYHHTVRDVPVENNTNELLL